ncbi:MAG TPA: hypothetical protein PLJ12_13010 [Planctomycetota bacterium]|nr:hypothetical protein [Planctomycetota bacterium]
MNAVHRLVTRLFDLLVGPFERFGSEWVILGVGAVFGVLALWVFKHISPQRAIRASKERIKGHLIEIRLYQDDLRLVSRAIGKVLWTNLKYLGLNVLPFVPLSMPFALIAGQLVVRYGFEPIPVHAEGAAPLAGSGITVRFEMAPEIGERLREVRVVLPEGLVAGSPLVKSPEQGLAFQEIFAVAQGLHEIQVELGEARSSKMVWSGPPEVLGLPRVPLQPLRVSGWEQILWPAEAGLHGDPLLRRIEFAYPESRLGWLPGHGPVYVLVWFLVASMVAVWLP